MKDPLSLSLATVFLAAMAFIFVLLPLPIILLYSTSSNNYSILSSEGFTLKWYINFFSNDRFMAALKTSLALSVMTTIISLIIALPTSIYAVRYNFWGKTLLLTLISGPLIIPGVIIGVAALSFVSVVGIETRFWPLCIAMVCLALPLTLRPLIANLAGLDPNLENAARNLGASPLACFFKITMPQLTPGLIAGGIFAFVEAIDNFAISAFLVSINTTTLPIEAFSYIRDIDDPTVAAMASILIILSVATIFIIEKLLGLDRFLNLK